MPGQGSPTDVRKAPRGRGPYGIATTPDGQVYHASLAGNHIARIDTESGDAPVIEPPTAGQGARRVWSDSRGNIWVSYWNTGHVGRYAPASQTWKEWKLPGNEAVRQLLGRHVEVWGSEWGNEQLARVLSRVQAGASR